MDSEKSQGPTFVYIGNDSTHWQDLVHDFKKTYPSLSFKDLSFFETDPKKIQTLFLEIYELKPKAIFIDFTRNFHEHLHLARLFSRTNTDFDFFLGGLIEGSGHKEVLKRSILTGISSLFVKSTENDSLIYSCMCIAFPSMVEGHGFATANLNDTVPLYIPARASVIDSSTIHIESNEKLEKNEEVNLHSDWSLSKILYSPLSFLEEQTEHNLFYPFLYAQKLRFKFVSNFEALEGWDEETRKQKKQEHEEKLANSKARMDNWVELNSSESYPKQTKALVIDRSFHFYENQERTDSYPFVLRLQPFLKDLKKEILKNYADMIIYRLDDLPEKEEEFEEGDSTTLVVQKTKDKKEVEIEYKNDLENLLNLITTVKSIDGYRPLIIVFNSKEMTTDEIKKKTGFEQIMVNRSEIIPDLILKMAEILNKKLETKHESIQKDQVFLDKQNEQTYVEIEREIKLLKLSENDAYFLSEKELPLNTPLRITTPVEVLLTVVSPPKHITETGGYYAVINGLGESEKMNIRKFINSVFFRQKDEAKRKEKEAFEELNTKVHEEREKKAEEERLAKENPSDEEE